MFKFNFMMPSFIFSSAVTPRDICFFSVHAQEAFKGVLFKKL